MTVTDKIIRIGYIQDRLFALQYSDTEEVEVLKSELRQLLKELDFGGDF